jgi:hypothetical protein
MASAALPTSARKMTPAKIGVSPSEAEAGSIAPTRISLMTRSAVTPTNTKMDLIAPRTSCEAHLISPQRTPQVLA